LTQEIGKVSADVSIRQAPRSLGIRGHTTYLKATSSVTVYLRITLPLFRVLCRRNDRRRRNGDEFGRIHSQNRWSEKESWIHRTEDRSSRDRRSGPYDKELNFPLVLYLRGRGENDDVSA